MEKLPKALVGDFVDAVVAAPDRADALLRAHAALLNARWIHDETVLHFLAVEGFADGVAFLAARGADVNAVNEFGDAPLADAAALGHHDIAATLLKHGANPNATSVSHDNVLHAAARSGNAGLVELLLRSGADARYRTDLEESIFDAVSALAPGKREVMLATLARHGVVPDAS